MAQIDAIQKDVTEIKNALLGDNFGNIGYMKRMEDIEVHIEDSKKRIWVERGIMIGLGIVVGILSNLIHLVK